MSWFAAAKASRIVYVVRYGTWYEATVIATNTKSVKMHFEGREGRYEILSCAWHDAKLTLLSTRGELSFLCCGVVLVGMMSGSIGIRTG